jgi:hypothetical protein
MLKMNDLVLDVLVVPVMNDAKSPICCVKPISYCVVRVGRMSGRQGRDEAAAGFAPVACVVVSRASAADELAICAVKNGLVGDRTHPILGLTTMGAAVHPLMSNWFVDLLTATSVFGVDEA